MKSSCIKAAVAAAVLALLGTGPAASAETAKPAAKHHKAQTKARIKAKAPQAAKAKPAEAVAVAPAAVPVEVPAAVPAVAPAAVAAVAPVAAPAVTAAPAAVPGYHPGRPAGNPYLAYQAPVAPVNPWQNTGVVASNFKALLPSLPEGQSLLPSIKRVYPTGEKPLVVVTFKCPTELVGVNTPSTKGLHELVNLAMGGINATNLLAFNLQQVCQ